MNQFNNFVKKFRYIIPVVKFLAYVRNPIEVIILYFKPKNIVVYLKNSLKFEINNFHNIISIGEIFLDNEYLVKRIVPKVIVDIGANIGDSTIFFGSCYPKAIVYAYEPANGVFDLLTKNILLNKLKNIKVFKLGILSKSRSMNFFENAQSGLSSLYFNDDKSKLKKINTISFTDIFSKNKIKSIDLLKIDCEGGEFDILLNLKRKTYKKIKNIVVEYHDKMTAHNHKELIRVFRSNNFKTKLKKHKIEKNIGVIYATK